MPTLLERIRRVNRLVQEANGCSVSLQQIAAVLHSAVDANIFIATPAGELVGSSLSENLTCDIMLEDIVKKRELPQAYSERLLAVPSTRLEIASELGTCFCREDTVCPLGGSNLLVVPVHGGSERLGTVVMERPAEEFSDDDFVLGEYAATLVAMEILRARSERIEEEARRKAAVQMAIDTLSYSEQEAVEHIFDELNGVEGLLVASKVADRVGITRSVIVNALRKFESAGVIESRSLGMKGTYIRVLNDKLFDELEKLRVR